MKIISVDNYDREIPGVSDDRLVITIQDPVRAALIVSLINEEYHQDRFYRLVDDDYQLRRFVP